MKLTFQPGQIPKITEEPILINQAINCRSCVYFEGSWIPNGTGSYMGCSIDRPQWNTPFWLNQDCPMYKRANNCIYEQGQYFGKYYNM